MPVVLALAMAVATAAGASAEKNGESKNIVDPYQTYSYEMTVDAIDKLAEAYPDLVQVRSIGTTVFGRDIRAVKLGHGEANVLVDGSQHAREWMGTNLVLYMLDRYAYAYEHNMMYDDYVVRDILNRCSIWFVPMVNPDGVTLVQNGAEAFPSYYRDYLVQMNGGSTNFKHWKANAEGIDINRQYPAVWSGIRNSPPYPSFKNFKGTQPAETAEAQSMIGFTREIDPEIALSYHTSGEVLYWYFNNTPEHMARDKGMADKISSMTGYSQIKPEPNPSGGGFTDWFIQEFGRPGFTAELGGYQEETELPLWTFTGIWEKNTEIGLYLASEGYKLWRERYPTEAVNQDLLLLGSEKLYKRPDTAYPTGAELTDANVTAEARMGNWFRIATWMGPQWVYLNPSDYVWGTIEPCENKLVLKEKTGLYAYPGQEGAVPLGELNPQEVQTLKRLNDWHLIRTWFGTAWVHAGG